MERLLEKEEGVVWPEPREDLDEEPDEPWARDRRSGDRLPEWIPSQSELSSPE